MSTPPDPGPVIQPPDPPGHPLRAKDVTALPSIPEAHRLK
jgi:hypothetical protein